MKINEKGNIFTGVLIITFFFCFLFLFGDVVGEIAIYEVNEKSATGKIVKTEPAYSIEVKDMVRKKE